MLFGLCYKAIKLYVEGIIIFTMGVKRKFLYCQCVYVADGISLWEKFHLVKKKYTHDDDVVEEYEEDVEEIEKVYLNNLIRSSF